MVKLRPLIEVVHWANWSKYQLSSLSLFVGNPGIQKCGLKVLSSLTHLPDALEMLSLNGAVDSVLHTLQMYPDDQGCLITKKNFCIKTGHLLAKILVSSLQRFKDVAEVQTIGLQTILAILEFSVSFPKLLVHHSFDLVLFHQMSSSVMEQKDEQFLNLCCKCFAKLAVDDESKSSMLERACEQNNSIMVECLLLLGADANQSKGATSLIYQVCERENSPKLVELLLNGGCREQDVRKALAVSIQKGDSQVISLLLRRLALDLANNSICLGGFCMRKIDPSWLGPLFPDKSSNLRKQTNTGSVLARKVLRYQMKNSLQEGATSGSDGNFSEDALAKFGEWTFIPDSSMDSVFGHSDDLDSEGSSKLQSHMRHSDSSSSLVSEREYITSLDLSANELKDIDALSQRCCLSGHLEHLTKLELHQNALTSFPQQLCETLKCLTHLDLHSNKFTSFPSFLLKMTCITNLDASRNDIGPTVVFDPLVMCPSLKHLNLSYNQLSSIPENLAQVAEKLEQLLLEGNKISGICSPLSLKELKILNLSKNHILSLPEDFLEACPKVESFSARMNSLAAMPALPFSITSLKLSQNGFTCIPEAIFILPHLRSLDMSHNNIQCLPGPAHWKSLNLRELFFSHNHISTLDLSEKPHVWSRVEKLHLSHNKLKEIPPEIGCLENLTSLDVSYNLDLRSFPNEMGKLSKIWDLPLDGLHLNLDFKHIGCKAKDIIRFLQQRLKKAVPYNRMKLMIVGNTGSGKTTLLQQLMKVKKSDLGLQSATVGIDVRDWPIQIRGKRKKDLVLNVWDFAGREEFYSTHPHFMTQRALYLAVYDLSKGQAEVDAMKPWLFNIKARASSSPVILVGTHLDVSDEKQRKACISKITKELLNKRGFPTIRDYHFVNATEESDALAKLRKTIINESLNFKIRDQPVVGQLIPDCYVKLEKIILSERKAVPVEFPVINRKQLLQLVNEHQLQLEENELPHAVHFLNESVKVEGCLRNPKGIISRRDVEKFLSKKKRFPKTYMAQYFKLLEKFQIALPIGDEYLLVPSRSGGLFGGILQYTLWGGLRRCSTNDSGCILLGQVVDHIDSLMEEWFPGLLEIDICGEGETLLKKWALYSFNDGEEHQKILLDDLMKKAEEALAFGMCTLGQPEDIHQCRLECRILGTIRDVFGPVCPTVARPRSYFCLFASVYEV
ncbi:leucine-rich repeat serine/threonine-protein kinase 2 [Cricetulus griseus]|uniref:non-specific serine/threonine protein kinase n=1 Tax=Cricetulus griseus TaxID=10029 RepID=A0A061IDF6_CRIGR|nr:leucine-rich repeat serine/threonine-protein kinase 2 [Cricetulus griseus]